MWQDAGLCGFDPFHNAVAWETPPNGREEEDYAENWVNEKQRYGHSI